MPRMQSMGNVGLVDQNGEPFATSSNPFITGTSNPLTSTGMTSVVVNTAVAGDVTIATAAGGQTTRVHRMRLNTAGATTVTIKSGTTTLEVLKFTAAGFIVYDFNSRAWYTTALNQALILNNSAAVQVDGVLEVIKSAP